MDILTCLVGFVLALYTPAAIRDLRRGLRALRMVRHLGGRVSVADRNGGDDGKA